MWAKKFDHLRMKIVTEKLKFETESSSFDLEL